MKRLRYLAYLPAIIFMIIIFCFSAKTGDASTEQSDTVSQGMVKSINQMFHLGMDEEEIAEVSESITKAVRKTAHFGEYMILMILLLAGLHINQFRGRKLFMTAIAITFCYAGSDEFHQYFVQGRYSSFVDVMIDTAGGIAGYGIFSLWIYIFRNYRKKKAYTKQTSIKG